MGFTEIIVMVGQVLLALALLVGLHEGGHMLAAKAFGMKVEKFSIGFPPKILSFKKGETEYSLGLIPLGGFVKITGMMDESMDKESLEKEPEPYEFRAKPAWQRLIVMLGGIIVNVITGVIIYIFVTFGWGKTVIPLSEVQDGIAVSEMCEKFLGLQNGDKIISFSGKKWDEFNNFNEIVANSDLYLSENATLTISRKTKSNEDSVFKVNIPSNLLNKVDPKLGLFSHRIKFNVNQVYPNLNWGEFYTTNYAAAKIGLDSGDYIRKIGKYDIVYFDELRTALQEYKGQKVDLTIERDGKLMTLEPTIDSSGIMGFTPTSLTKRDIVYYGFGESMVIGTSDAFKVIYDNIRGFGKMFSGNLDPRKSLGGPVKIAQLFGTTWNWARFWTMTAMLSMILAFMNILPIPVLDGGHVMFLLYEMISGRKPSDKFMEIALKVGMALLLGIMLFAIGNDFGIFS